MHRSNLIFFHREDLLEFQKVAKIGFVDGVGKAGPDNPRYTITDSPYWTDGMRAVFIVSEKSPAPNEVEFFDWKRLYQKYESYVRNILNYTMAYKTAYDRAVLREKTRQGKD